jgi:hypothetical protein
MVVAEIAAGARFQRAEVSSKRHFDAIGVRTFEYRESMAGH